MKFALSIVGLLAAAGQATAVSTQLESCAEAGSCYNYQIDRLYHELYKLAWTLTPVTNFFRTNTTPIGSSSGESILLDCFTIAEGNTVEIST